jgi:hypothetical protein
LNLKEVPRLSTISADAFLNGYFKPQTPVVIEGAAKTWPAYTKWDFDYIKQVAGEKIVPLYDDRPVDHKEGFNEPHARMKMSDYIELLQQEPTKYRIFLWNILKEIPELREDFDYPDFGLKMMKGLPMLFFGGSDSSTFMHYDIDLANIFHFHFEGEKECVLFSQSQNKFMYKIPHSLISHEGIDFSDPDYEKWPALRHLEGYRAQLKHGEMIYIPEGYWHYMRYLTPGFSMSLRAVARTPANLGKAIYNIAFMRYFDMMMRKLRGRHWIDWKNEQAIARTHRFLPDA